MRERKRILFVDNLAVEASRRGVYRALAALEEFEVHLLVPRSWREQGEVITCEEETNDRVKIHTTRFLFGYRFHRVIYTDMFSVIRQVRPHFLYVDTEPENYASSEALLARSLFSPSMKLGLVTSRNLDHRQIGFPYKLSLSHRLCDTMVMKRKVDVLFLRTRVAAQLVAPYALQTCYLPFSVDCNHFKKSNERRSLSREGQITLGFIGRLVEGKGVKPLVESLPYLPANVDLLIIGKGPLLKELQALVSKLEVGLRISFLPPVPYTQIPQMLNNIDILILPSLDTKYWVEQCPRILIEAMACEVPIVASQSGGIPEVIGEAGIQFRTGTRDDLVEKLLQLIKSDSLRAELAWKGRKRACELFDVPVIANRLAEAIEGVLTQAN